MNVIYQVTVDVNPGAEAAWFDFSTKVHFPEVLAADPGFVRTTAYRSTSNASDGRARYVIQYEIESQEALERYFHGEGVKRLRADVTKRFGVAVRITRDVLMPRAVVEK